MDRFHSRDKLYLLIRNRGTNEGKRKLVSSDDLSSTLLFFLMRKFRRREFIIGDGKGRAGIELSASRDLDSSDIIKNKIDLPLFVIDLKKKPPAGFLTCATASRLMKKFLSCNSLSLIQFVECLLPLSFHQALHRASACIK